MSLNCSSCGAELIDGTNFCRQCGKAITTTESESEQPTAIFTDDPGLKTQVLESRATGEPNAFPPTVLPSSTQSRQTLRWSVIAAILSVLLICIIGGAWIFVIRGSKRTSTADLIYPGAKTIVDMKYDDGGRAVQLETNDSLGQVESWYKSSLKLQKTVRLSEGSIVLKSENKTITLVNEDNKTNVLIKLTP